MAQIPTQSIRCEPAAVRGLCARLLELHGLPTPDARLLADTLIESNLRGVDSHGIARLQHYLRRILGGSIEPRPDMRFEALGPATGRVDGGHGMGQIVMARATQEAIRLAGESGAGWVSVCNSSHCGALSYFGLQIASAGMIGLVFTHVDPMVLPHDAAEPFCGTNPICVTMPGRGGKDICLDMATSVTPWNSVANAAMEGVPIPMGWAVDRDGVDTTDAREVAALYPVGGHKGAGLGLVIDVLCGMLSGAPIGPDIPKMYGDYTERRRLGGLVGVIDVKRFVEIDVFRDRIERLLHRWGQVRPASTGGRVLFPGQPELETRAARLREGVPLGLNLIEELHKLADQHGLPRLKAKSKPAVSTTPSPIDTGPPAARADAAQRPCTPDHKPGHAPS
ncbi:MAG: Ldh family oxidoreductase [Phycisphaerales bacterium JB063]